MGAGCWPPIGATDALTELLPARSLPALTHLQLMEGDFVAVEVILDETTARDMIPFCKVRSAVGCGHVSTAAGSSGRQAGEAAGAGRHTTPKPAPHLVLASVPPSPVLHFNCSAWAARACSHTRSRPSCTERAAAAGAPL